MTILRTLKSLIVGAALLAAGSASAADLASDSYYQNTASPAVYDWTGAYVGAHVGYGWGSAGASDTSGWIGGILGGYNVQSGQFVLGLEGDYGFSSVDGSFTGGTKVSIDNIGTVRARAGFAVDQFLIYGTGGFSFADINASKSGVSDSSMALGWVIGVGAEAALSRNWTARIEAFYYDLGSDTYNVGSPVGISNDFAVLRAGVSYKF